MEKKGTTRSLVEDLRRILAEDVEESVDSEDVVELEVEEGDAETPEGLAEAVEAALDAEDGEEGLAEEEESLSEAESKGKSLEKQARDKRKERKTKRLGSGRNPFKTKDKLGPGPRAGKNAKTKNWKCACTSPYKCQCRNRAGQSKTVRIKRDYKKAYNHEYKQWRKSQKF